MMGKQSALNPDASDFLPLPGPGDPALFQDDPRDRLISNPVFVIDELPRDLRAFGAFVFAFS